MIGTCMSMCRLLWHMWPSHGLDRVRIGKTVSLWYIDDIAKYITALCFWIVFEMCSIEHVHDGHIFGQLGWHHMLITVQDTLFPTMILNCHECSGCQPPDVPVDGGNRAVQGLHVPRNCSASTASYSQTVKCPLLYNIRCCGFSRPQNEEWRYSGPLPTSHVAE